MQNGERFRAVTAVGVCVVLAAVFGGSRLSGGPAEQPVEQKPAAKALPSQSVTERGVTLTLECPSTLLSGAENYITLVVRNEGDETVYFQLRAPQSLGVGFKVFREGEPVAKTALGEGYLVRDPNESFRSASRIEKNQESRIVVNLTRYYDLSRTGRYQIAATWNGWASVSGTEKSIQLRTKPLDFKVEVKRREAASRP